MEIKLKRFAQDKDSTLGLLFVDDKFECFTLEDPQREDKIKSITSIPEGCYEVKFREVDSPMTKKYRNKFNWFTYHLELQDVPEFKYVYIHIGNTHEDSDGCILVGKGLFDSGSDISASDKLLNSTGAFTALYKKVASELSNGCSVTITIKDIKS